MEGEAGSEGDNKRKRGGADDNSNDNNGSNSKIANSNEGQSKPKRQMKTPFQLQNLEKAYALDTYPSEAMRLELSEKLGLSDRQLQMWFCHRRLKDKNDLPPKKRPRKVAAEPLPDSDLPPKKRPPKVAAEPLPDSPTDDMRLDPELGNEYGSGSGSGSSPLTRSESRNAMPQGLPGYYESPQAGMERREISSVEAQLGEPLREDEPILGVEFDPLPPDAFGAPIAVTEQRKRPSLAYDSKIYDRHDMRANKAEKLRHKEELRKEKEAERRKAALEKATARRMAKESMELIEDEQLELMELAASSKGFSSIIRLDFDTLQNLESYKDSLCVLPPKSVKLRKPFAIQPWINSEENVGNLLMKLPSRYNPFKSPKVVEPEPADSDHDDLMKVKSAPMKIARSSNKRGRGSHDKGRGKKRSKRAADISNSAEEAESDDNAQAMESDDNDQAVEYDQGNWEICFNVSPIRWSRHLIDMSGGDVEASEDDNDNGIEEEDSKADVMSEGSDGMASRVVNGAGSDSADSEDSSD